MPMLHDAMIKREWMSVCNIAILPCFGIQVQFIGLCCICSNIRQSALGLRVYDHDQQAKPVPQHYRGYKQMMIDKNVMILCLCSQS
jgi:hypothetical protein